MDPRIATIVADVRALAGVRRIPGLADLVGQAAEGGPRAWLLPGILGASCATPLPAQRAAAAALACFQLSVVLVDDLLDADPRGAQHRIGVGAAANLALALQAAACESLLALPDRASGFRAVAALTDATTRVARGQHLDAQGARDEDDYWRVTAEKSGAFFALAFALGAWCGPAPEPTCAAAAALGAVYGDLIQIHDDLRDSLATPAAPDWREDRASLPILYASQVAHPERDRFVRLRGEIARQGQGAERALAEAQHILQTSGAVAFGLDQILRRAEAAQPLLAAFGAPDGVRALFTEIVAPVEALLNPPMEHVGFPA